MCDAGLVGSDLHVALNVRGSEAGRVLAWHAGDVCAHMARRTCCASRRWVGLNSCGLDADGRDTVEYET